MEIDGEERERVTSGEEEEEPRTALFCFLCFEFSGLVRIEEGEDKKEEEEPLVTCPAHGWV